METSVYEDDSVGSVYSHISSICRRMVTSCNYEGGTEQGEFMFREFRKLAYSYLLKKKISSIKPSDTTKTDIPLELFMCIAHRQTGIGKWTKENFTNVAALMERYEAFATNNQYCWLYDMGKMLLALGNHLPPLENAPEEEKIFNLTGIEDIPSTFRLSKGNKFHVNLFDHDGCGSLIGKVEAHVERMRNPPAFRWPPVFPESVSRSVRLTERRSRRDARTTRSTGSRSNSASPFTDEGFSSPSSQERVREPYDWSTIPATPIILRRDWESIGVQDPFDETKFENPGKVRRLRKSFQFSPCNLVKIDRLQLIVHVKALLTGIASDVFPMVENQFAMTPGLYTDGTPPIIMFKICKPLREAGALFASLNKQQDGYPCSTSSAMDSVIKHYLLDYQAMIMSIPGDIRISELVFGIIPYFDQLDYLSRLQKTVFRVVDNGDGVEDPLRGWKLLQELYTDFLRNGDPNLGKLISGIFLECCQMYFGFIDEWIFEGKWHPDLFFQQTMAVEDVTDRYGWLKMFSFQSNGTPAFLPAKRIFECGRMVHLVKNMFMVDDSFFSRDCRPRAKLVTNRAQLEDLKNVCRFYSHTGIDLRSAVMKVFTSCHSDDIVRVALEKASADSLKFIEAKAADHERKISLQRVNLETMKREIQEYRHHRNVEKLKISIYELMQDDQNLLYELKQLIASSTLRYELIERFVEQLDRVMKKTSLNSWKEKRYALTANREKYFGDDKENLFITPKYESNQIAMETPNGTPTNEESEIDSSVLPFKSRFPLPNDSKSRSVPNEEVISPKVCKPVEQPPLEEKGTHELHTKTNGPMVQTETTVSSSPQLDVSNADVFHLALNGEEFPGDDLNEQHREDELENPPDCCRGAAFDDPESPLPLSNDVNDPHGAQTSFDRIMNDYERRVQNATLKPFAHISRFNAQCSAEAVSESVEISPDEFSKSFVSYHLKKSISYPLEAQNKVLNNLVLHKFFVENEFMVHLERLRNVFFRHDGVSAQTFTHLMCSKIERERPDTFLVYPKLQNILNLSFQADSDFISLKAGIAAPSAFDFTDPHVINCLRMTYLMEWPLKLILTEKAISRYNEVFQFIFSIDRTLWYVKDVSNQLRKFAFLANENFTQLHLQLHSMLVAVSSIKMYTGFCVEDGWKKFHSLLVNVKCPDKLYRVHVKYVKNIMYKLMMVKQMSRVHGGLTKVLHYVLVYCQTLKLCDWHSFTTDRQYFGAKSRKLSLIYENFRIMVDGSSSLLAYFIKHRGHAHLKMLHQSLELPGSR